MAKKLHYFNTNGFAEPIRYMLYYSGVKFEDIRYERESWPVESVKEMLPYGKMPFYEEGDRKLNQSLAIARYVASQNNLLPSDPWEQAVLDAAVFNIFDFVKQVMGLMGGDEDKKEENKKKMWEAVEYFFSRFEKELEANNGYFGGKLTWADFVLVGIVEAFGLFLGIEIERDYPTVKELIKTIRSLPGIKEYLENKEPYKGPART